MSHKKIFKEIYSNKINKDNNYKEIIKQIENNNKKSSICKKILVPITSFLLVSFLIFINIDNNKTSQELTDTTIENKDYELYINNTDENMNNSYTSDIDIVIKNTDYQEIILEYNNLENINIPNDLKNKTYKEIYTKDNTTNKYTILNHYQFLYQSKDTNRQIVISFSNENKPLKENISINDNYQISKINNTEIVIYQNKNSHKAIFIYNNIYFDIETNNIKEEELINLLTSIIK